MNGVHDMGGMHGFGPVEPEANEPPFHNRWEGRVLGMQRAMGAVGLWNIDQSRFSLESLAPLTYLGSSYYKKWELGLESRLLAHGLVGADELAAGHSLRQGKALSKKLAAAEVAGRMTRGSFARPTNQGARFSPGDRVRARNINPESHTRLPRYARGHTGIVEAVRGCHVFPDAVVRGEGEDPQWLYTVVFSGVELWGEAADPGLKVSVEAFEPYLDPA
ncbi:MAG TPA: nitrile hydratase subunit beta [Stellaceae bacterium]|nr:nitrile hydratase subunit beta [Stellaceae bacterium]